MLSNTYSKKMNSRVLNMNSKAAIVETTVKMLRTLCVNKGFTDLRLEIWLLARRRKRMYQIVQAGNRKAQISFYYLVVW